MMILSSVLSKIILPLLNKPTLYGEKTMLNLNKITAFPQEVIEKIGFYVYRLLDPRNGETFYVGKGKGNRVFNHSKLVKETLLAEEAKKSEDEVPETSDDLKFETINRILKAGLEPIVIIHRHGMDEATAFHVEDALMDAYPSLANKVAGHGNSEIGTMHVKDLIDKYKVEEADFGNDKVILININASFAEEKSVYDAVRFAWRINVNKAQQADYILAVSKGVIRGVFIAQEWKPAIKDNFPEYDKDVENRYGFKGADAPVDTQQKYLGKRIPDSYRKKGAASPIKYNYS